MDIRRVTKKELAREVSIILNLPIGNWPDPAYELVRTIQKVMTAALLRGEEVEIPGFGIFRKRVRPAMRRTCGYFYGKLNPNPPQILKTIPAKTYIHFQPSKALLRYINSNGHTDADSGSRS